MRYKSVIEHYISIIEIMRKEENFDFIDAYAYCHEFKK